MLIRVIAVIGMLLALASFAGSSTTLLVRTSQFKYDPPQWTVPTGQRVTVRLINDGNEEHEWVLLKTGGQVTVPFDDDDEDKIAFEVEVEPGGAKVGFFTAPAPGTHTIVCGAKGASCGWDEGDTCRQVINLWERSHYDCICANYFS